MSASERQRAKWREAYAARRADPEFIERRRRYVRNDYWRHVGRRRTNNRNKERRRRAEANVKMVRDAIATYGWQAPDHVPVVCMVRFFAKNPCMRRARWGSASWHICDACRIRMLVAGGEIAASVRILTRHPEPDHGW